MALTSIRAHSPYRPTANHALNVHRAERGHDRLRVRADVPDLCIEQPGQRHPSNGLLRADTKLRNRHATDTKLRNRHEI
jgi:hypothetical protein